MGGNVQHNIFITRHNNDNDGDGDGDGAVIIVEEIMMTYDAVID